MADPNATQTWPNSDDDWANSSDGYPQHDDSRAVRPAANDEEAAYVATWDKMGYDTFVWDNDRGEYVQVNPDL